MKTLLLTSDERQRQLGLGLGLGGGPSELGLKLGLGGREEECFPLLDTFHIPLGSEKQEDYDYVVLGHSVEILGRVLMDVAGYVRGEQGEGAPGTSGGMSGVSRVGATGARKSQILEIGELVERLGNRIGE